MPAIYSFLTQAALLSLATLCSAVAHAAPAALDQAETCAQIRTQIKAQTGLLPRPDTALLEQLGKHSECRFSAAEVYRAAYGDRPLPKNERHKHHDDDDDDD